MNIPDRMRHLECDKRGYPIPWNVMRCEDGTPMFVVNDSMRGFRAQTEGRCPVCGGLLGKWRWFVGGPLSAFDPRGWYADQAGHHECMQFALATCPYLAAPSYKSRIDERLLQTYAKHGIPKEAQILLDETQIAERPDLFVAIAGSGIEFSDKGMGIPYSRPKRPIIGLEFWKDGQQIPAHRAMPILRGVFGAEWELPKVE